VSIFFSHLLSPMSPTAASPMNLGALVGFVGLCCCAAAVWATARPPAASYALPRARLSAVPTIRGTVAAAGVLPLRSARQSLPAGGPARVRPPSPGAPSPHGVPRALPSLAAVGGVGLVLCQLMAPRPAPQRWTMLPTSISEGCDPKQRQGRWDPLGLAAAAPPADRLTIPHGRLALLGGLGGAGAVAAAARTIHHLAAVGADPASLEAIYLPSLAGLGAGLLPLILLFEWPQIEAEVPLLVRARLDPGHRHA